MESTQQTYPKKAAWRTAVQTGLSVLLTLGLVLPLVVAIIGEELGAYLPESWLGWLFAAAACVSALAASAARIMAIPAVDNWLKKLGLSSTPN